MEYKMFHEPHTAQKPISEDLVKIIELANAKLLRASHFRFARGQYSVNVYAHEIWNAIGKDKAQEVIVEAIDKLDRVTLCACGSRWFMFSNVAYDGFDLRIEYRPKAASVLMALLTEVKE